MTATALLIRLYRVDQQLRGLGSRLRASEVFLSEQDRQIAELDAKITALSGQIRQLEATMKNDEVEVAGIDERTAMLRERMNNAQTSKEHSAHLTEISTLKADKKPIEDRILEAMTKVETQRAQLAELEAQRTERQQVRKVALTDRDARAAEIKDRVKELEAERTLARDEIPAPALSLYDQRVALGVEDVMAVIEEQDRRNMEYTCGSCYTHLPIEQVNILLKRGDITKCPSCQAILYIEANLRDDIQSTTDSKKKSRKAQASTAADEPF